MSRLPHLLHLEIDKHGWIMWSLDCPYSADEVDDQPGRPCNLVTENTQPYPQRPEGRDTCYTMNPGLGQLTLVYRDTKEPVSGDDLERWNEYLQACDDWEQWIKIPGCFAQQFLTEGDWEDVIRLGVKDPQFPIDVDVVIEGDEEDAYISKIVPWVPKMEEESGTNGDV